MLTTIATGHYPLKSTCYVQLNKFHVLSASLSLHSSRFYPAVLLSSAQPTFFLPEVSLIALCARGHKSAFALAHHQGLRLFIHSLQLRTLLWQNVLY